MHDILKRISENANPFVIASGRERDMDMIFKDQNTGIVRFIRSKRCETVQGLFGEYAAAFQFPYYFGSNWAAFDECIQDLSWLSSDFYTLVITNTDIALSASNEDIATYFTLLNVAAKKWRDGMSGIEGNRKAIFTIVLHCQAGNEEVVRRRLKAANITAQVLEIAALDDVK